MSFVAIDHEDRPAAPQATVHDVDDGGSAARVPSIRIHAFCETPALTAAIKKAAADRRMSRAALTEHAGGARAALKVYRGSPTPELIILESRGEGEAVLGEVDALAAVCDAGTKVLLIGRSNDIDLYRGLMQRGVSEYLRLPLDATDIISAVAAVYSDPGAARLGRVYAFVGARGGVGSSILAHNVAWTIAQHSDSGVILADMDMSFGTAALDFNITPERGIAEAVREPERLDEQMLERLLTRFDQHLSVLAAPALLGSDIDLSADAVGKLVDLAQSSASHVVLDVPHLWSDWARRLLFSADEIVLTASPDLASLRNAQNVLDLLRQMRPHDAAPKLVLNQVGVPKRPEIKPAKFAASLGLAPLATLPFDPKCFGGASNTGRMLPQAPGGRQYAAPLRKIAEAVTGHKLRSRRFGALGRLFGARKRGR